jgi:hypothetical protein
LRRNQMWKNIEPLIINIQDSNTEYN